MQFKIMLGIKFPLHIMMKMYNIFTVIWNCIVILTSVVFFSTYKEELETTSKLVLSFYDLLRLSNVRVRV